MLIPAGSFDDAIIETCCMFTAKTTRFLNVGTKLKQKRFFICLSMKPLERIVGVSSIGFRTFTELINHIRAEVDNGRKPLIAVELPDYSKFIVFHSRELRKNPNRTYRPVSEDFIYDCSLPDGFFSPNGEGSFRINHPVDISYRDFRRHAVYVIRPGTNLEKYIGIFMESGRNKAHEFWKQATQIQ